MCCYNTLHQSKNGYIIQCRRCDSIQVAFGTTALTLSLRGYEELTALTQTIYNRHKNYAFPHQKMIVLPTSSKQVSIICNVNELIKLKQMLSDGKNNLEMTKLFIFHEN